MKHCLLALALVMSPHVGSAQLLTSPHSPVKEAGSIKGDVKKKHFARAARGRYFSDIQPLLAAAA